MATDLPPLPEPVDEIAQADGFNVIGTVDVFTAAQMRSHALAAVLAERERIAAWIEPQRNDIPACGFEFAAAIRALAHQEPKEQT